jgi:hypothetical protein
MPRQGGKPQFLGRRRTMNDEYTTSEVIEIGMAEELILGKEGPGIDEGSFDLAMTDFDE